MDGLLDNAASGTREGHELLSWLCFCQMGARRVKMSGLPIISWNFVEGGTVVCFQEWSWMVGFEKLLLFEGLCLKKFRKSCLFFFSFLKSDGLLLHGDFFCRGCFTGIWNRGRKGGAREICLKGVGRHWGSS